MFHSSLTSALTEATPLACQALLSQGVKFVVAVENGIAPKPFLTVYEQCGFEDDAV